MPESLEVDTDAVDVGKLDVDEPTLVCEALADVVPTLVVVTSAVVVVELGGSNVVAVMVACVSRIAPDTDSQTWYTLFPLLEISFSEHSAYRQLKAASPKVSPIGVWVRHRHLISSADEHSSNVYWP
jgi:hypothetical protein